MFIAIITNNEQEIPVKSESPTIKSTVILTPQIIPDKSNIIIETRPALIQKNDPLENYIDVFFKAGELYQVDPYLMLAIAQLESVFGKSIPYNSHNPFGRICGKEYKCVIATDATTSRSMHWNSYTTWEEAIYDESKYLRDHYYDKGLITTCQIANKYAEDKNWCKKIEVLIVKFKAKYNTEGGDKI